MAVSLSKGSSVSLTKESGPVRLVRAHVGLGWDPIEIPGRPAYDLDASAFILGANDRVLSDSDFVFYNNLSSTTGAVTHTGDNRDGSGDGDDESLIVTLEALPPAAERIVFSVTIDEAEARGQSFGQVRNAFIRVANADSGVELARFDLSDGAAATDSFVFGELYRDGAEWRFGAIGEPASGGLGGVAQSFGVNVG